MGSLKVGHEWGDLARLDIAYIKWSTVVLQWFHLFSTTMLLLLSCLSISDSVWPQRQQPTRLLCPWDSPGKNTGMGCHFLLQCMKLKSEREVAQSCPTFSDPIDCSQPGSSVYGIFQARGLEWVAIAFSIYNYDMCWKDVEISREWTTHFSFVFFQSSKEKINIILDLIFQRKLKGKTFLSHYIKLLYTCEKWKC